MSVTGIINNNTLPEINSFLRETSPSRSLFKSQRYMFAFDTKRDIIAPYKLPDTGYASVVGTAFDYLARFEVAKILDNRYKNSCLDIVAKYGLYILWYSGHKIECKKALRNYEWSCAVIDEYIYNKAYHSMNKIIDICCFFARLEHLVRSGKTQLDLLNERANSILVDDLTNLITGFKNEFIGTNVNSNSTVVFNPTFRCFHGADADIFIDGVLYDFKTGKDIGYNWHEVAQLWAYYLLHEIDYNNKEIDSFSVQKIKRFGIYRGRCADIDYIDVSDIPDRDKSIKQLEILLKKERKYCGCDYSKYEGWKMT